MIYFLFLACFSPFTNWQINGRRGSNLIGLVNEIADIGKCSDVP